MSDGSAARRRSHAAVNDDRELTSWLCQEVLDLVAAGPVGLYEFLWLLNGDSPEHVPGDSLRIAAAALRDVRAAIPEASVRILRWPDFEVVRTIGDRELSDLLLDEEFWQPPGLGREYAALSSES